MFDGQTWEGLKSLNPRAFTLPSLFVGSPREQQRHTLFNETKYMSSSVTHQACFILWPLVHFGLLKGKHLAQCFFLLIPNLLCRRLQMELISSIKTILSSKESIALSRQIKDNLAATYIKLEFSHEFLKWDLVNVFIIYKSLHSHWTMNQDTQEAKSSSRNATSQARVDKLPILGINSSHLQWRQFLIKRI